MSTRYGLRFKQGAWVPTVEVTVATLLSTGVHHEPIKRVRGVTNQHAMSRAIAWSRAHGDNR